MNIEVNGRPGTYMTNVEDDKNCRKFSSDDNVVRSPAAGGKQIARSPNNADDVVDRTHR